MPYRRQRLLGIWVDCVEMDEAVTHATALAETRPASLVISGNLNFADLAGRNTRLKQCNEQSELTVADGMPFVVASWYTPFKIAKRLPGSELLLRLCAAGSERGQSFYFVGRRSASTAIAVAKMQAHFPAFRLAGTATVGHPLTAGESEAVIRDINRVRPNYLILALGQPHGELWAQENLARLDVGVVFQVGNALDLISGFKRRVPRRLGNWGMEWAFRLLQEPTRLGPRYYANAKYLARRLWTE